MPGRQGEERVLTVLRRRDFALLWFAGLVSLTGDWMLVVALPVTVYKLTGSALATGGVLIANKLPALVLGSVAGALAVLGGLMALRIDRAPRPRAADPRPVRV